MKAIVWPLGRKGLNPTRLVALGFGIIILLGAALLHLPIAARGGEATSWLVCLFTAASATCVTGLVQVDTVLHWSPFGQGVILLLLQLGGLGFVSLITLVSLALQRRIGLSQRLVMASALNLSNTAGVVRVVRHALMGTFLIEGLGALLLSTRLIPLFGLGKGIWFSLFHSVSAFCNGGFDLMGEYTGPYSSLLGFQGDPVVLLTIMGLIVVGGIGFFVWEDILENRSWRRLSLYTKMALSITGVLIVGGCLFCLWTEWNNPATLGPMEPWEKVLNALFQSVTLRTAGYASLDQAGLTENMAVLSAVWMLIGGSSGSTAGGIKTVTIGVLLLALGESLRGKEQVVVRGRTIPQRRVLDAMTLTLTVLLLFLVGAMALSRIDGLPFLTASYEVASALGTVGLSMGATPNLSAGSSVLIILYMYLGRVGLLSFSIAFLTRRGESKLRYPTVDVMIG
ncbi:potassium transporter TrkG [Flavonifractor sp. An100]|uniref:TrkH family potassium uptake protein n=1 Tax=Flavonifractor sp. An100 TaxID=1965538 RepID=UPI000B398E35|nr:potassium transporter TrkG [Flavonifractor sp. An100]OUQ81022.1 potassium uptake protein, TrkH family [Flavonifractor sp. An100]